MAKLKAVYDSRDAIPEGLADYYSEQSDGKFKIALEGDVKTQADVDKVMKALTDERDAHKATKAQLKSLPADFDAEKWNKLKHLDPDNLPTGKEDVEKVRNDLTGKIQTQKEQFEQQLEAQKAKFHNTLKETRLRDALVKAGVTNSIRLDDAVSRIMKTRGGDIDVIEKDDDYRVVVGALQTDPVDFVKEWADTEEGKNYVNANGNAGGGAGGGGGGGKNEPNPFAKETFNLTKQMQLKNTNPQQYERLKAAASA